MAHNANTEDYQRLVLRHVTAAETAPADAMRDFASFWQRAATQRDSLAQTDADRAFHLVALATNTVDYQLPFVPEAQVEPLLGQARTMLDEALSLDPACHDALRMRTCMDLPSFDERLAFLAQEKDRVRASCEEAAEALPQTTDERRDLAFHLAMAPYLRWLATLADHALVCGHNRSCLDFCHELLALDPTDISDVRFTLTLCLAKLEDEEGLNGLSSLIDPGFGPMTWDDAWTLIARAALAYKAHDLREAGRRINDLLTFYPNARNALVRQSELPDGLFARIRVAPYSEDELVLALSEATVLTQEGAEEYGQGPFGMWIVDEVVRRDHLSPADLAKLSRGKRGGAQ